MSATFKIDYEAFDRLQEAIKDFQGNSEEVINEVLHGEGSELIQESIKLLIPVSGKEWKGKAAPAKSGNSLRATNGNLEVTIRTQKRYQYLYFPDDGTNTRRHVGDQQFFLKGAENVSEDIVERCITRLINNFEEGA